MTGQAHPDVADPVSAMPVLYSFRRCPYAIRARLALRYAGIRCELREVELRRKPAALTETSAKGTVPVLVTSPDSASAEVIDESLDVMLWALGQHDPEGWLDVEPQLANDLIEGNDDEFKVWLDRYKYPERYELSETGLARAHCERFLRLLERRLEGSPFLLGARVSLADAALFPFVRQYAFVDRDAFRSGPFIAVNRWLNGWLESPLFRAVMTKHPVWQPGESGVIF